MTTPYKKRAKGSWCQGKGYKGDAEERQFEKTEIRQELETEATGQVRHRGKRKKNEKARLEYRIHWYQQAIAGYKDKAYDSYVNSLRDGLKVALEEYQEKYGNKT